MSAPPLTVSFRALGERVIVLKALVDAYTSVLANTEVLRQEAGDDLDALLALAEVADHANDRLERFTRLWRASSAAMEREDLPA